MDLANRVARRSTARLGFLILLKTFQRLGYFMLIRDVPAPILEHIAHDQGFLTVPAGLSEYDDSGSRRRHVVMIREYLKAKPFGREGLQLLGTVVREAARTKEDLTDLIKIAIEELLTPQLRIAGFTTLLEEAQRGRTEVNRTLYGGVYEALGVDDREMMDRLWRNPGEDAGKKPWNTLKQDPGSPTLKHLRELIDHHRSLASQQPLAGALASLPTNKVRHFAGEAKSLDAARMREMEPHKRYTLAAALLHVQLSRVLDDIGRMFVKRMMRIHRRAKEALALHRLSHQDRTDNLVRTLHGVVI